MSRLVFHVLAIRRCVSRTFSDCLRREQEQDKYELQDEETVVDKEKEKDTHEDADEDPWPFWLKSNYGQ